MKCIFSLSVYLLSLKLLHTTARHYAVSNTEEKSTVFSKAVDFSNRNKSCVLLQKRFGMHLACTEILFIKFIPSLLLLIFLSFFTFYLSFVSRFKKKRNKRCVFENTQNFFFSKFSDPSLLGGLVPNSFSFAFSCACAEHGIRQRMLEHTDVRHQRLVQTFTLNYVY